MSKLFLPKDLLCYHIVLPCAIVANFSKSISHHSFFLFLKCHGSYKIIVDDSKCNIHNKILIDVLRQKVFLLNYRKIPFSGYLSKFNNLLMGLFGMLISICFVLISSYEIITENYFWARHKNSRKHNHRFKLLFF